MDVCPILFIRQFIIPLYPYIFSRTPDQDDDIGEYRPMAYAAYIAAIP